MTAASQPSVNMWLNAVSDEKECEALHLSECDYEYFPLHSRLHHTTSTQLARCARKEGTFLVENKRHQQNNNNHNKYDKMDKKNIMFI